MLLLLIVITVSVMVSLLLTSFNLPKGGRARQKSSMRFEGLIVSKDERLKLIKVKGEGGVREFYVNGRYQCGDQVLSSSELISALKVGEAVKLKYSADNIVTELIIGGKVYVRIWGEGR